MSAVAVRTVCGACGAAVRLGDAVCPACGAALEFPAGGAVCPACGLRNAPGAETCRSCGARLAGSSPVRREGKKQPGPQAEKRPVEPWIIVAGLAVVALVVAIVVLQSPPPPATGRPPVAMPAGSPATAAARGDHIALLEQAVRERPGDPDALRALANGLHDHRDWERAIDTYQRYLQKNPGDPDARVDMGICYFELSQVKGEKGEEYFAKAVAEIEGALRKSPGHVPAAFNLGVIYLQRGLLQQSNEWFRRAVAIDRNHPLAQRAQRMLDQHAFGN
jgi:cytochrome c-type biogenesis protein CcmH/NrfG